MALEALLTAPPWFTEAVRPLCNAIGLPPLAAVFHLTLFACASSFALQHASSVVCPILFPKYYPTIKHKKADWDLHVVGWAYSLIAAPLAFKLLLNRSPEVVIDKVHGLALREARLSAMAVGYFLWDGYVSIKHIKTQGIGFVLHGVGCLFAFAGTLRPFLLWNGPNFLIWETSTIFLNIHWYLDKFQLTGSTYQLVNGLFLVVSYVFCRLVWGVYMSYMTFSLLMDPKNRVGNFRYMYYAINIIMNGLNFMWFRAMVLALRKRFVKPEAGALNQPIEIDGKMRRKAEEKKAL